jgi:hypothetical protein
MGKNNDARRTRLLGSLSIIEEHAEMEKSTFHMPRDVLLTASSIWGGKLPKAIHRE